MKSGARFARTRSKGLGPGASAGRVSTREPQGSVQDPAIKPQSSRRLSRRTLQTLQLCKMIHRLKPQSIPHLTKAREPRSSHLGHGFLCKINGLRTSKQMKVRCSGGLYQEEGQATLRPKACMPRDLVRRYLQLRNFAGLQLNPEGQPTEDDCAVGVAAARPVLDTHGQCVLRLRGLERGPEIGLWAPAQRSLPFELSM
jgi:hypothetical protein